jgi:hypothetical protein
LTSNLINDRGCTVSTKVVDNDFVFLPTDVEQIIQIVEDFKNTNSVGFDVLRISCLKKSIDIVAPHITYYWNRQSVFQTVQGSELYDDGKDCSSVQKWKANR